MTDRTWFSSVIRMATVVPINERKPVYAFSFGLKISKTPTP